MIDTTTDTADATQLTIGGTPSGGSASPHTTVTWNPTLDIAVPAAAVAGTCTGVITRSVA
ncbi:hypothetical protein ABZ532_24315 [Streptomyces sp. NPDC019396]|uniref:hypothetical protein n=1 Tax=Streptomyces sp. NPDC019396 TaxID=3154687 RepID=UPI00340B60C1